MKKAIAKLQKYYKNQITVTCDDLQFKLDVRNKKAKEVYYPQQYRNELNEPALTQRLIDTLGKDSVFYDVGANVGYYTALGAELCSNGKVYSFELDPDFVKSIKNTIEHYDTEITIENMGLGNELEKPIHFTDGDGDFKTEPEVLPENKSKSSGKSILSTTIDDYIQSHQKPDVVKIDVDGFEYKILQGADDLLSDGDVTVFVEIHRGQKGLKNYGDSVDEIIKIIKTKSYDYQMLVDQDDRHSETVENPEPKDIGHNSILECHF